MSTDELCSAPPPSPENWDVSDLIGAIDPDTRPAIIAKLIRMTKAHIWDTYCEYGTPVGTESDSLARLLGVEIDTEYTENNWKRSYPVLYPDAHMWVHAYQENVPSIHNVKAHLNWMGDDGWSHGQLEKHDIDSDMHVDVWVRGMRTYYPDAETNLSFDSFQPQQWWQIRQIWNVDAGQNPDLAGRTRHTLTAWALDGHPQVPAWPQPSAAPPLPYQFSAQAAADLTLMGSEWTTHRIAGAIVPGMLSEIQGMLAEGLQVEGTTSVFGPDLVSGSNFADIPEACVGLAVSCAAPASYGFEGDATRVIWNMGYIAVGSMDGMYPSQRLKHENQLLRPIPPGATQVRIDLHPGVTGVLRWLMPAVT